MLQYVRITMGDIMEQYSKETYKVIEVERYRLKENATGIYWYPMNDFFKNVLFRSFNSRSYRDNELYSKYMRVIKFEPRPNSPIKTWFINEEGLHLILKNLKPIKDSPRKQVIRDMYEAAAKQLVNVHTVTDVNTPPKFINFVPDLSKYDVWSIICLTNDKYIKPETLWKRCDECGFYYPDNQRYFSKVSEKHLNNRCRKCCGGDFVCTNSKYQYIYKRNGYDLIYLIYNNASDEKIAEKLKEWLG